MKPADPDAYGVAITDFFIAVQCDCCGLYDYDENITTINDHDLCGGCAEDDPDFIRSLDPAGGDTNT